MKLLFLALMPSLVFAAIDGTVVNKTSGKPLAGANISLIKPGQGGMRTLGTATTDATGHFAFTNDEPGGGPQLLQVNYQGVNYNKLLTPNIPTAGVEVDVYDATRQASVVRVAQRMLVFAVTKSQISVDETVMLQNNSNLTFGNPKTGSVEFYLPPAANGQVQINAQGPQGMPLPEPAEKTERENIYKVQFPVKPGETQFQIAYSLPVGSPFTFRGEVVNIPGMIAGPMRLVAPSGVTLAGKDLQTVGVEPTTQATVYNVLNSPFSADITGTGALGGNRDNASGSEDDESSPITEAPPQIYTHMNWLLGVIFATLAVGLVLLFRRSPVRN